MSYSSNLTDCLESNGASVLYRKREIFDNVVDDVTEYINNESITCDYVLGTSKKLTVLGCFVSNKLGKKKVFLLFRENDCECVGEPKGRALLLSEYAGSEDLSHIICNLKKEGAEIAGSLRIEYKNGEYKIKDYRLIK